MENFQSFYNQNFGALRSFGDPTLRGLHWPDYFLLTFIQLIKTSCYKYKSLSWLDTNLWKAVSVSDLVSDCRSISLLSELLSSEREKLWLVQSLLQLHPGKQSGHSGALKYITRQGHISSSSDGTCWSSVEYVISDKQVIRD